MEPRRFIKDNGDVIETLSEDEISGLTAADLLAKIEADGWIVGRHVAQDPEVYDGPEGCGMIIAAELDADAHLAE
jgi:hypothetical protein